MSHKINPPVNRCENLQSLVSGIIIPSRRTNRLSSVYEDRIAQPLRIYVCTFPTLVRTCFGQTLLPFSGSPQIRVKKM
jgi:hypothetical protein